MVELRVAPFANKILFRLEIDKNEFSLIRD